MPLTADRVPEGLPPGRLITPDRRFASEGEPVAGPALWITDEPMEAAEAGRHWARLLTLRRDTGLWPLLLGEQAAGSPWHSGSLEPVPPESADRVDVDAFLARGWHEYVRTWHDSGRGDGPPVATGPGPPAGDERAEAEDPDEQAIDVATNALGVQVLLEGTGEGPFLGLVPANDGADALSVCGWVSEGGGEHGTAVLRDWQRRFGVRLCALGDATLALSVAWPPRTPEHATHVAAEHFAYCPDLAQNFGFEEYAAGLVGARVWSLWWD